MEHKSFRFAFQGPKSPAIIPQTLHPGGGTMGIELGAPKRRGYLNPALVARFSFWTTTVCVLVAVVVSILAIWQFMGTDSLWRTVATCAVIAAGTLAFSWNACRCPT